MRRYAGKKGYGLSRRVVNIPVVNKTQLSKLSKRRRHDFVSSHRNRFRLMQFHL